MHYLQISPQLFSNNHIFRAAPVLIVHGDQREALIRLKKEAEPYPNIKLFQVCDCIRFITELVQKCLKGGGERRRRKERNEGEMGRGRVGE